MPELWTSILEAFLLVAALSTDAFFASFAYGTGHIRIPFLSVAVIDGICTALLAVSLFLGTLLRPWAAPGPYRRRQLRHSLPSGRRQAVRQRPESPYPPASAAEQGMALLPVQSPVHPEHIRRSPRGGSGRVQNPVLRRGGVPGRGHVSGRPGRRLRRWQGNASPVLVLLFSLLLTAAAVMGGSALGNRVAARLRHDLSWVGGALLLLLAAIKLL